MKILSKGIVFILIATFSFAIMNALVKDLSAFHPMQLVGFRSLGTFVFIFPYMLWNKVSIIGNHPGLLSARAVCGLISLATFFVVLQRLPLGSAISIRYLGPIFGAVMAAYFLKEKVKFWQWISFAIAFTGVIVLKGFDLRIDLISFLLTLTSAFFLGFIFTLLRYLGDKEHFLTIINYFMFFSIVGSLFFLNHWRWPNADEWWRVMVIGICGMIGQIFMTKAFQIEEASTLAPFKYMELVYALIMGLYFFDEKYSRIAFAGILLIVAGMILNVVVKKTQLT